jgi:cytochrome P450
MKEKDTMPRIPTGVQLTPFDADYLEDPYPVLKQLRENDPLHHDTELQRYFPCQYADVKSMLKDPALLTDPINARADSYAQHFATGEGEEVSMLMADEPRHLRLRRLVNDLFKPRAVEKWRARIEEVVELQLRSIQGPEFDLIEDFAQPVPTVVIAEIMGIPTERQADFKLWSNMGSEALFSPAPSPEAIASAREGTELLTGFFLDEIAKRRQQPNSDLISQLVESEIHGDKLSDEEIVAQCSLLLLAGNLTTTDMIGNGVRALLEHPDQLALLRKNPDLIAATVEEILRYDSPVLNSGRITHADIEFNGCPIKQGECLHVSLAGGNHDPAVFTDPEQFNIEREQIAHLSFGGGRHFCLGAHLARMEGEIAIGALINHFPQLRLSSKGFSQNLVPEFRGMSWCWLNSGE